VYFWKGTQLSRQKSTWRGPYKSAKKPQRNVLKEDCRKCLPESREPR
jgi:hypothetical protein